MSAWTKFATDFFREQKKKNPSYTYGQALEAASPLYKKMKKGGSSKKQRGGDEPQVTGDELQVTGDELQMKDALKEKKYSFTNDAADFLEDPEGTMDLETLRNMIEQSTVKSVSAMKNKFNMLEEVTDDLKFELEQQVPPPLPPVEGGRKSRRKSKKAGKKSQKKSKKAKKAGSKKSKK